MCYLCLKDDVFPATYPTEVAKKRQRAADVKKTLRDAETKTRCGAGEIILEVLRQEQYKLAKDL